MKDVNISTKVIMWTLGGYGAVLLLGLSLLVTIGLNISDSFNRLNETVAAAVPVIDMNTKRIDRLENYTYDISK